MTFGHLVWRTLRHYRGSSLAVIGGLAVATAVIAGSLVIGTSLRGSLLDLTLARLGGVNHAAVLPRPVSDQIVSGTDALALLRTTGTATPAQGEPNPVGVTVWGVDEGFVKLQSLPALLGDGVLINAALARDLHVRQGDEVALSVNRPRAIGMDSLFARRELTEVMATLTMTVAAVLPDNTPGDFRLDGQSGRPRNAFLPRDALQRALAMPGKANALVAPASAAGLPDLAPRLTLGDYGLHLRVKPKALSLTSDAFSITEAQRSASARAKTQLGASALLTSAQLATTIRAPNGRELSYAIVVAMYARNLGLPPAIDDATEMWIALNTWAAQDLGATVGDRLTIEYLVPSADGTFQKRVLPKVPLVGIVPIQGVAADPHLIPAYEGLTDAIKLGDWKPPFPIDMSRVTPRDDEYWEKYKTVPKAFVEYGVAQQMWGEADSTTSIEIAPPAGQTPSAFAPQCTRALLYALQSGPPVIAFRNQADQARQTSAGSTDFSQLFLALSMFIIAAGVGLAAMLIGLGVERRVNQIGLLLALGVTPRQVRRLLLAEGMILNLGGVILGLPVGVLYAWALLKAMGAFWTAAIGDAPALWLHVGAWDLPASAVGGLLIGWLTIVLALRGLGKLEPMRLWQSGLAASAGPRRRATGRLVLAVVMAAAAAGLLAWTQTDAAAPKATAFFGAGALLLTAGLVALHVALTWPRRRSALQSLRGLAWRNASQNPRRSLLICGLIAAATFVIIATAASTRDFGRADTLDRAGPAGGFNLMATSQVPLPVDPATPAGRRNLGFSTDDEALLSRCTIASFLSSPGDDLSCANAAKANTPQLIAPTSPEVFAGADRFSAVRIPPPEAPAPPTDAREITASTDAGTLEWRLYKQPGDRWQTEDAYGRPFAIRLYAGFTRSILAGQLLTSERELRSIYPDVTAPSFFLIETPRADEGAVTAALRRTLADLGLEVRPTREILGEYAAGENVYISMFIALGALGLLLGTVGLAVITARNIIERRAELALLTATGFSRPRLVTLLLLEHGGLLVVGLLCGAATALIAMVPQLRSPESSVSWAGLALALVAVLAVGLGANVLAIRRNLDEDLVGALRHE